MPAEPSIGPRADAHVRWALPYHVGDAIITGENQIRLPAEGLRELGWEQGDQLLVQIVDGDMVMLRKRPIRWADAFAGKLGDVFGDHEAIIAYLNEERQTWGDE